MASEDKVRVLREKDVIFDRSVKHYINECKRTHQDFQINQVLGVSWVGSPSAIKLASSFKGFVRPNGPEDTLRRSFRALLLKRFEKASTDVCFNPADPPAWLRNALENPFFCTLLSDLYKSHPSNKVFEFGERHWRRKQQQENSRLVVTKTLVERFAVPFVELVRSNEEVIEAKLASFAIQYSSHPNDFLMVLSVLKAENLEMEDLKLICSQLGDIVYNDSKRHPQLGELTVALGNLRDEEFASRLNLALSRPLITSDVVIQMLWDTCINRPTSTAILAARLPALMEKLVDYVYISKPPVPNGLDPMKRKAIDLMACLRHTEADGSHGDIGAFTDSVETLRKLYTTLSLPLSKMLLEIDPVRCDIFNSKIIVKYIHTYVKASEYYEGYIDPKTTPLLHTRLKQLADRHFILRPEIVSCFFECLKAPSPTARRSTTGKANIYGILNHIVAFMRLGEEQLVIRLFKENVSIIDDEALTHAIKTIFCSIRPPFTISFVHWMCEWLIHVANHSRHLVLQSGILNKFLILTQSPVNLIPTPYHPNIKQTLISMIGQLNTIASGK